jgi:hypothetical protein
MPDFQRDDVLDLEYGVRVRSVGVGGRVAEVQRGPADGRPVRDADPGPLDERLAADGLPEDAAAVLAGAAGDAGMRRQLTVPLDDLVSPATPSGATRGDDDTPHLEIDVPAPAEDEGQVVLEVDSTGVVHWHVSESAAAGGGTDRAGPVQTFRIPIEQVDVPTGRSDRGFLGYGLRKVLHVIRFPVEAVAAHAGELAVGWWERRQRPYGLGLVQPDTFTKAIDGDGVPTGRLAQLADKPFLLLIHGTFSRGRSGFRGIAADAELLKTLCTRYQDRVLVFDHPSVHLSPEANARWLLERLPDHRPLTLDVVTHSRGGLVARQLMEAAPAHATGRPAPVVRTLVHVATPNAGTTLASKDRLGDLLDVFSNLLSLLPDETVSVAVEGVLEVVKQVATGVLGGLDGLAAMDPEADSLRDLNDTASATGTRVHAVATDFKPSKGSLAIRALDLVVDPLFGLANDLVVPTEGVYKAGSYLVDEPFVVPASSQVTHTTFFRDADVRARLSGWLPGS